MKKREHRSLRSSNLIPVLPERDEIVYAISPEEEVYGHIGVLPFYFGTRRFGIVDHVPGLFYVATVFWQAYFIPLVPIRSYIFYFGHTTHGVEVAVPIWFSVKSLLFAWARLLLLVAGGLLAMVSGGALLSLFKDLAGIPFLCFAVPICIACFLGIRLARVFEKASPQRAEELAMRLGFGSEVAIQIRTLVEDGVSLDQQAEEYLVSCPSCGREVAPTTPVCPRCEKRLF